MATCNGCRTNQSKFIDFRKHAQDLLACSKSLLQGPKHPCFLGFYTLLKLLLWLPLFPRVAPRVAHHRILPFDGSDLNRLVEPRKLKVISNICGAYLKSNDWLNTKKAADIGLRHLEKAELKDPDARGKFLYRKGALYRFIQFWFIMTWCFMMLSFSGVALSLSLTHIWCEMHFFPIVLQQGYSHIWFCSSNHFSIE